MQDWSDKLAEFDMLEQGLRQRQGQQVGKTFVWLLYSGFECDHVVRTKCGW